MSGITEQEYASWLEKALQALYKSKPLAIAIVAKTEAGNTLTGYYNAAAQDKAVFATISRAISCWILSRQMPQKSRP